jgi:hypothetical protein
LEEHAAFYLEGGGRRQKTAIFIVIAMETSSLAINYL